MFSCARCPARRVSTVHGLVGGTRRARLYEWLQCRAYRNIDAVAVSRKLAIDLIRRGVDAARVHTIPNAVPPAREPFNREVARKRLGVSEDLFSVGWVGRVSHEKGLDVLLDAMRELGDLPIQLTIVGGGPERRHLEAFGVELHPRANWAGVHPDAARMLAAFDVVVLSSRTEGTPMVLLEAMSASVPVVATSVGGIPDVISQQEGLLVPSENPGLWRPAFARSIWTESVRKKGRMRRALDWPRSSRSMRGWTSTTASTRV